MPFPIPTGDAYLPFLPRFTFGGGSLSNPTVFAPGGMTPACDQNTGACVATGNRGALMGKGAYWTNFNKIWSGSDDFSRILGNHSIKTGVYIEKNIKFDNGGSSINGIYDFGHDTDNPYNTGHGYANALLGIYKTYSQQTNAVFNYGTSWTVEGYVQDNWRMSNKFTLDVGLRWSHMGPLSDLDKSQEAYAVFDRSLWSASKAGRLYWPTTVGGKNVAIDKVTGATASYGLVGTIVPGSGSVINGMKVVDGQIYELPFLAFAPRVGFAWNVTGDGKMAIRGSFGVFYNRPTATDMSTKAKPPTAYTPSFLYGTLDQITQMGATWQTSANWTPTAGGGAAEPMKLQTAYQGNFTIQRDIGFGTVVDLGWVGTFDRHAPEALEYNPIPKFAYADPANLFGGRAMPPDLLRTKYPGMGSIAQFSGSRADLNYHAMQLSARRRMTHGLQFGLSYTLSKALGTLGWDPFNNQREWYYGPLATDRTHSMALNYTYLLPNAGTGIGFVRHIINNWTLSGITSWMSGFPVTPTCQQSTGAIGSTDPSLSGLTATGAVPGTRCQQIADLKDFKQDFYNNFNKAALTMAAPGTFGSLGLNTLRQPSRSNWDMTLARRILLGKSEAYSIRIRIEAYNVFNHTQFQTIGSTYTFSGTTNTNTETGQYTATYSPRTLSTTVRFEF